MLSACASVLPTSANDVGSAIPCWRQSRCRSASASPVRMPRERAPLVARQLAAQVVHEAGLVGPHRRQRHREDQVGDVVGAVVRDREQQERERRARVVVEPADQPEVEQREPPVRRQQHVSAVRIGVVEALDGHLADVRAEECARELRRTLLRQRVTEIDAFALDELQHHHLLGHERVDHLAG